DDHSRTEPLLAWMPTGSPAPPHPRIHDARAARCSSARGVRARSRSAVAVYLFLAAAFFLTVPSYAVTRFFAAPRFFAIAFFSVATFWLTARSDAVPRFFAARRFFAIAFFSAATFFLTARS